jgi:dihydroxy-acid dehydratase
VLYGYPLDGVVLTIGCDKTTPACADGGGDGQHPGDRAVGRADAQRLAQGRAHRLGHDHLEGAQMLARGEIDDAEFIRLVASSAPSTGYCNTMGTATTMNSLAEALGMSLPGSAAIPAPYRDRQEVAWRTGKRIVEMVHEDLKPSDIMTKDAFLNAIAVNSAIGGSTNAPIHIARSPATWASSCRSRLAGARPRDPAAGQPAAGRRVPRRGLLPRGRRARGGRQLMARA